MKVKALVKKVKAAVNQPGSFPEDKQLTLAREFKALCLELNKRLEECSELIRCGYRSEALRISEFEPNLLDSANELEFDEKAKWVERCKEFDVEVPPILHDLAFEINEAYEPQQANKELIETFRRQSVFRRPQEERESTLRRLCKMDQSNSAWRESLNSLLKGKE